MPNRPRLVSSVPFWILLGGSVVTLAVGAWILYDRLTVMTKTLTDGTATGVEVYVGQAQAVLGAALVGAGLLGLALAAVTAVVVTLTRPIVAAPPTIDWSAAAPVPAEPAGEPAPVTDATEQAPAATSAEVIAEPTDTDANTTR